MGSDRILDDLAIRPGEAVAITGTGGKTTLLWFLAGLLKHRGRVIVSVTAKMFPPEAPLYQKLLLDPSRYRAADQPDHSVWLVAAGRNEAGKLLGISGAQAAELARGSAYVVLEADGSRGLPLKMWYDHEPPVPDDTELTLGILPVTALYEPATARTVYNLDGFLRATGLAPGDPVTPMVLAEILLHPDGLFKHSPGRRILVLNQCDTDELAARANRLIDAILAHPRHHELTAIVTMSLKEFAHENYSHYTCRRIIPENEPK